MAKQLMMILAAVALAMAAQADQSVGKVSGEQARYIEVPVYHDTTGRSLEDLTDRELHFLSTVPTTGRLRDAVGEMLPNGVCHVPEGGVYVPGTSRHYWGLYQSWTGPKKVQIPLFKGEPGKPGPAGPQGPPGPPGPPGQPAPATNVVVNNYTFGSSATPSFQLGGALAPVISSTSFLTVSLVPAYKITATATGGNAKATGGEGGSVGPIDIKVITDIVNEVVNNVSQQQQQQQQQQQDVGISGIPVDP